jgi:NO-binding membrane sensor protein with MHYT domain
MENMMNDSDYALLTATIFLAPHLSKGWGLSMWAIHFIGFLAFVYVEKFA